MEKTSKLKQKSWNSYRWFVPTIIFILIMINFNSGSGQVTEEWVVRYNGPANLKDQPTALAVDAAGNVYVTGYSDGPTSEDYATIKYDPSGNEMWAARYDGPGNFPDWANALALDASGNVYVTGESYGLTNYDYATIKYDPSGNEMWVARYNGTGNYVDSAKALSLDVTGNVYVTGDSADNRSCPYNIWRPIDIATIKYDPSGNKLWVARYKGQKGCAVHASALALDSAGNIYVTGDGDNDITTIKLVRTGRDGNATSWLYLLLLDD